jgi:hypothetical protein
MARIILTLALLLASASALAVDFTGLGYERVYNSTVNATLWVPPGYTLNPSALSDFKISDNAQGLVLAWDSGEFKSLVVRVYSLPAEGKTPLNLMETVESGNSLTNLISKETRELPAKRLSAFSSDAQSGLAGKYSFEVKSGLRYMLAYYVSTGDRLYLFVVAWSAKNEKAGESARWIKSGFVIGEAQEIPVSPPEDPLDIDGGE